MVEKLQVIIDNCGEESANIMITTTTVSQFRILPKIAVLVMPALLIAITACGQVTFKDSTDKLDLEQRTAAAWADFNDDGFVDLCDGNGLWLNDCAKKFAPMCDNLGTSILADFNNDGLIDVFSWKNHKLFRNIKGMKLVKVNKVNLQQLPTSNGACCGDFDGDGYVDIYLCGYLQGEVKSDVNDTILKNLKGQSFKIDWRSPFNYPARGVTACDFDEDADLDIYVSYYKLRPNVLLLNDGKGNVENLAEKYGVAGYMDTFESIVEGCKSLARIKDVQHPEKWATALAKSIFLKKLFYGFTIGSAWGDLDNDGHFDLFVGNLSHWYPWNDRPMFYKNLGPLGNYHFQDKSANACLKWQESYASPALGDYDNDGDLDLFVTTVYDRSLTFGGVANYPVLFRNNGNWTFKDVASSAGLDGLMLEGNYQAAWADFDNDGDLDLITAGKLFENQGNKNNWLKVQLKGDGKKVNSSAIGAQVRIKLKDRILTRQVEAGTGKGNQNDLTLHFGLGTHNKPVDLEIFWPNGTTITEKQVRPNQLRKIRFAENK